MIVVDAGALIALAGNEPAAADVEGILRRGQAAMSAVNVGECLDVLVRRERVPKEIVDGLLSAIDVRAVGLAAARSAARLRATHYHRTRRPLSLADCFLLAAAGPGDEVATSDQALAEAAGAEGIPVVPLANSKGVKPRRGVRTASP